MNYRSDRPPAEPKNIHRGYWCMEGAAIIRGFSRTIYLLTETWEDRFDQIILLQMRPDRIDKFYKGDV